MKSLYILLVSLLGLPSICFADYSIRGIQNTCPNTVVTYYFGNSDTKNESYDITVSQEGIIVEYQAESGNPVPVAANTQTRNITFSDTPNQSVFNGNGCYVKVLWGNFRGNLATINGGSFVPTYIPWRNPRQEETLNVQIGAADITGTTLLQPSCASRELIISSQAAAGASSYQWQNNLGWTYISSYIFGGNIYATFNTNGSGIKSGQITLTAISNVCPANNSTHTLLINRTADYSIEGPTDATGGPWTATTYSTAAQCSNYNWSVPSGWTIIGGQGTSSISVSVLNGSYPGTMRVTFTDACSQANQTAFLNVTSHYSDGPNPPSTQDRRANPGNGTDSTNKKVTEESATTEIAIYPNPVADELRVNPSGAEKINIYNSVGALVREVHIAEGSVSTLINTFDLPNGNYHVRLVKGGKPTLDKQVSIMH